jgi:nucleotide-binding universal stress UspA family protein
MTKSPKQVLVATDFSEGSDEALAAAIDLAKGTGAQLEILYVMEIEVEQYPVGFNSSGDSGSLVAYVDRELSRRADLAARAGLRCVTKSVQGSAVAEIVQHARNIAADMIVVGTHGRRGLAHVMLGSVAEKVVQRAACPVLTIPFSKKAA